MLDKPTNDILMERVAALEKELRYTKKKLVSLQESETLYRLVVVNARDAIFLMDVDSERLIYANKTAEEMIGRSFDEMGECKIFDVVVVEEADISEIRLQRLLKGEALGPQEYTIVSHDGRKVSVEAKAFLIELGDRKIAVSIHRDISHRKNTEENLRETKDRYRLIMDNIKDPIYLNDIQTAMIIDANQAAQNMLGKTLDEIKGMTIFDILAPADRHIAEKRLQKLMKNNTIEPQEYSFFVNDRKIFVEAKPSVIDLNGRRTVICIQHDITARKNAEEGLKESEARYRSLIETMNDGFCIADKNGRITYVNDKFCKMSGYRSEEFIGKSTYFLIKGKKNKQIYSHQMDRRQKGKAKPYEIELMGKIGNRFPTIISPKAIIDSTGNFQGSFAVITDLSELVRAERAFRESEEARNALLNATTESALLVDLEGTILAINQKGAARLGKSVDEINGMTIERFLPAELLKDIYRSGKPFRFQDERGGKFYDNSFYPVYNENRETVAFAIFARDITQQMQAEKKLRESEKTARALLNIPNMVAAMIDPDCNVIDANDFMAKRFNLKREDLIGKNFLDILPKDVFERRKKCLDRVLQSKKLIRTEDERGGVWFDTIWNPIFDDSGKVSRVAVIARDISAQKQTEIKLKESVKEKEVLIREIHHRVKNNMQIINSLLQLQAIQSNDKKVNEMFEESRNRINTMALVHEKLYQSDKLSEINIAQYIRDLGINLFESFKVNTDNVSYNREIADISLPIDRAIPIGLILNELISNSLKYAFSDGRDGEIVIKFCPTTGDEVQLTVSDNGIGMPTEAETIDRKTLGLNLVKTLVEKQLNGKIEIDHKKGTQYRIRFLNT